MTYKEKLNKLHEKIVLKEKVSAREAELRYTAASDEDRRKMLKRVGHETRSRRWSVLPLVVKARIAVELPAGKELDLGGGNSM